MRPAIECSSAPGERPPTDGMVISGASAIDQIAVTGESIPVGLTAGSDVFGGTVNATGALELRVTAQRFAERFGARYTPAVVAIAGGVAMIHPLAGGNAREWIYRALVVLVVSCSCALVISVPTAVVAAVTRGTRDGVLIRGGAFLEALAAVRTAAFDKTGTLTEGRPRLTDVVSLNGVDETEVLRLAVGVEAASEHPLARCAIRRPDPSQEPSALAVHAGICPGGGPSPHQRRPVPTATIPLLRGGRPA